MVRNEIDKIANEYFEWMYHLVCNDKYYNKVSYRKLLYFLHSQTFEPSLLMDDNRRVDGIDFRYRFGYENGYDREYIKRFLDIKPCSVLEMMIALSFKVEEEITSDCMYGDRTGQWFWGMVVSLGLGTMTDNNFVKEQCERIIDNFLDHNYQRNGKGGLFTLQNPPEDLRNVEIWCQFMWYLNETIYNTKIIM